MSDPLLSKMDALMKKHRGGGPAAPAPAAPPAPPSGAWLPVLTDVIERRTPPPARATGASAAGDAGLADQLLCELTPRLSEAMERQVADELHRKLDKTIASLLGQLDINVRDIVRDAVAEKLKQPKDPSA